MDLDKQFIVRKDYTILDLISNLGGLSYAAFILVTYSYIVLQHHVFDNWLVHYLFRGDF